MPPSIKIIIKNSRKILVIRITLDIGISNSHSKKMPLFYTAIYI